MAACYNDITEILAIRPRCDYTLHGEEPADGVWWAVQVLPVKFPGNFSPMTPSGEPVLELAVIACEKNLDGDYVWCHLSQAAKLLFGDLLTDLGAKEGIWYYVVEKPCSLTNGQDAALNSLLNKVLGPDAESFRQQLGLNETQPGEA